MHLPSSISGDPAFCAFLTILVGSGGEKIHHGEKVSRKGVKEACKDRKKRIGPQILQSKRKGSTGVRVLLTVFASRGRVKTLPYG